VGLHRFAALALDARAPEEPRIDWARMELPLQHEGARLRRARNWRRTALPALAVATAAAFVLVVMTRQKRAPQPVVAPRSAQPVLAVAHPLAIRIAAIVGQAHAIGPDGVRVDVNLETRPVEGWTLHTGSGSELHVVLEGTGAVLLAGESQIALVRAREAEVELALAQGRVVNAVRPRASTARYAVTALGHEVAVRGTLFSVEHETRGLAVQVDEGAVVVLRDGVVVAELRAPQRWSQADGLAQQHARAADALGRPRELAAGFEAWPVLQVPVWPRVVSWEIDGTRLAASGELAMRVPSGDLDIAALLVDGRRMHARIHIDAIGARFDPRALRMVGAALEPALAPAPDPALAAAVIRRGQPDLQRCYERSLRSQPGGAVSARLRLRIDGRGRVREADLDGSVAIPAVLDECVRSVVMRWTFPAPGGAGITFEAPVRFQPRH
jgi:hypothetical protein